MCTGRTYLGGSGTGMYITAVAALPLDFLLLGKNPAFAHIFSQLEVAGFMVLLHGGNLAESFRNGGESFPVRYFGKRRIHVGPFVMLAGGCGQQTILRRFQGSRADGVRYFNASVFQQFEKYLGMFLLIVGRFQKDSGNLFVTGLLGYAGKVGVAVARF